MLTINHHFVLEILLVFNQNWFSKEWFPLDKIFHRLFNYAFRIKIIQSWVSKVVPVLK
jgi:hypothetical protein